MCTTNRLSLILFHFCRSALDQQKNSPNSSHHSIIEKHQQQQAQHHHHQQQQQLQQQQDQANEKKKPHIKKPLNAFMLYMKEMRAKVVAECTLKESAAINQILGRRVSDGTFSKSILLIDKFQFTWSSPRQQQSQQRYKWKMCGNVTFDQRHSNSYPMDILKQPDLVQTAPLCFLLLKIYFFRYRVPVQTDHSCMPKSTQKWSVFYWNTLYNHYGTTLLPIFRKCFYSKHVFPIIKQPFES